MSLFPSRIRKAPGWLILASCLSSPVFASESSYFILDGNPVAVKYTSGVLKRLPIQDANDVDGLRKLEAVAALVKQSHLATLSTAAAPTTVQISSPRSTEYGVAMFEVSAGGSVVQRDRLPTLAWSGPEQFREVILDSHSADGQLRRTLITQSYRTLTPKLDFRAYKSVGRRLKLDGPVRVRDYGRTAVAPHLAFVDVTWRIRDLPDALANQGIDSLSPFFRVEYVIDMRTRRPVYQNTTNEGGVEDWDMRLFKEAAGPLLMAVTIGCSDGAEPLIIDLEHESYGTGSRNDVPEVSHCFPAQ
jgi:hypothetical protein